MSASHRLLVIDDSLTIRKLVELSFRGAPFALSFATTGAEGVAKANQEAPDVILLDCVLPDMKAPDVCQRLAEHAPAAGSRVILMSAKDRSALQSTFDRFPQVADFVGKPFTADEILARVQAVAVGTTAHARDEAAPEDESTRAPEIVASLGPKETEAAAKVLYARLARPLAAVPDWLRQASAGPKPASVPAFLARKLLTPDLVSSLLEALSPFYKRAVGAARAEDTDPGAPLQGQLAGWSLTELLAFVGAAGRTGELLLTVGPRRLITYWESGEIVLCTSHDPADGANAGASELTSVPAEARARAENEQRATGTPVRVALVEAGALTEPVDLCDAVHEHGVQLLREARGAGPIRYVWHDRPTLPAYVLNWGRHISLSDDLDAPEGSAHPTEPTIAQLSLERLRRPSAWTEVDARLPSPDDCYERAFGFSGKLRTLRLTASEQRVLALVDRRNPLRAITQRTGLPAREVARITYRLAEIDLVEAVPASSLAASASAGASAGGAAIERAARSVMILDPDDDGFCRPLRDMLARRPRPVTLLDLAGELDVTDAISRERPGLVVLNEAAARGRMEQIARAVRAAPHLAGTALAAVVEADTASSPDALAAAGFDAVWRKPIHYLDLVALLAAEPPHSSSSQHHHAPIAT